MDSDAADGAADAASLASCTDKDGCFSSDVDITKSVETCATKYDV